MDSMQEWLSPQVIWFALGIALLLVEIASPGLIVGFFGLGALLVALLCLVVEVPLNLQLCIFVILSVASLLGFRRKFKTLLSQEGRVADDTISEEFIGRRALVTREIQSDRTGKVEFRGTYWEAEAADEISVGSTVEIVGKENLTLTVRAL
jgi:membrane protein implicated in regulation of membrane protease activity